MHIFVSTTGDCQMVKDGSLGQCDWVFFFFFLLDPILKDKDFFIVTVLRHRKVNCIVSHRIISMIVTSPKLSHD